MEIKMGEGVVDESDSMLSCAENILTSVQGTVPFMRGMGIPDDILSQNSLQAADAYVAAGAEQIEEWDERMRVSQIKMAMDKTGKLEPKVVLEYGRD